MRYLLLSAVFLLSFSSVVFADAVQGRVARVNSHALDLTVYDAQGRPYPNALHLKVDGRTRLSGVPSLAAFRSQDPVSANVRQETAGVWRADSVSLLQTQTIRSAPASPSLMDALKSPAGQKVIRGGLTGAITGAVASGASGGKAGKGALIGAGVGAAGGLLENLFSQHQQQSQTASTTVTSQEDTRR